MNSAIFKKFPTRTAAEQFIGRGSIASQPYSTTAVSAAVERPTKNLSKGYYGVKSGLKPGIYCDWYVYISSPTCYYTPPADKSSYSNRSEVEPLVKGIQGSAAPNDLTNDCADDLPLLLCSRSSNSLLLPIFSVSQGDLQAFPDKRSSPRVHIWIYSDNSAIRQGGQHRSRKGR